MAIAHPNRELLALGIRQPWAELILRGIKTIEVRTLPTGVRGPIYLYTGAKPAEIPAAIEATERWSLDGAALPMGVLVGTVEIVECRPCMPADAAAACVPESLLKGMYAWRIANPLRLDAPLRARFRPYGVWFYPFKRRTESRRRRTR